MIEYTQILTKLRVTIQSIACIFFEKNLIIIKLFCSFIYNDYAIIILILLLEKGKLLNSSKEI